LSESGNDDGEARKRLDDGGYDESESKAIREVFCNNTNGCRTMGIATASCMANSSLILLVLPARQDSPEPTARSKHK
jgi:hypothetical protein